MYEGMRHQTQMRKSGVVQDRLRRLVCVTDVFACLRNTDVLARLRKFGGRCVLGFQSSEGGGTARFASGLIGERESRSEERR